MTDLSHPAIQRLMDVASRKGVGLDVRLMARSSRNVEEVAAAVAADAGQIVKSLVFDTPRPDGRLIPVVCLVSGRNSVDPALFGPVTGELAIRPATAREAHDLLGYSTAGMPPFGFDRDVRIFMDQDLCLCEWVWAAAGIDTAVFRVPPRTLRMLANAHVAPLAGASWTPAAISGGLEPRFRLEAGSSA